MAYTDMSAHWAYKDLVTYQDLNQLGENDKAHTHDGVNTAAINTGADITMAATKKLIFAGDTYMLESAADIWDLYVGGTNIIKVTEDASDKVEIKGADLEIDAAKKLYLDGGLTTVLSEVSDGNVGLGVANFGIDATTKLYLDGSACNGTTYLSEVSDGNLAVNNCNIGMTATTKIYLDGIACTGDTYFSETAANTIKFCVGGVADLLELVATGVAVNGNISQSAGDRIYVGGGSSTDYSIGQAGTGSGTTTLYIGNASINVTSDIRLKKDIEDTKIKALAIVKKFSVKDFTWNDPSDKAINNRNSRGRWTGLIAQEAVEVCPFVVNAPRPEGKEIDHNSDSIWTIEYDNLVPVLIKAIQELSEKVKQMERK